MRASREQAAESRERIVAAASRLFRERGFDGVGIDAIMQEAGMTHGGFYRHFASKEGLAAEAVARGMDAAAERAAAMPLDKYVAAYLSRAHRDDPGGGCVYAALGCDIAREGPAPRHAMTERLRAQIERLAAQASPAAPGAGPRGAHRKRAIATIATLVGALTLARAVDDAALSDEILAAARAALPPA
ncbi:MAG: TetR/AcrR family transcriptional regulator [Proteobacteria bacterium]|nr:TetR/AcrR family transcriptional regulator [Pseudomonadota bacterium]